MNFPLFEHAIFITKGIQDLSIDSTSFPDLGIVFKLSKNSKKKHFLPTNGFHRCSKNQLADTITYIEKFKFIADEWISTPMKINGSEHLIAELQRVQIEKRYGICAYLKDLSADLDTEDKDAMSLSLLSFVDTAVSVKSSLAVGHLCSIIHNPCSLDSATISLKPKTLQVFIRDVEADGWERYNFSIICESCLGDNPYIQMKR
ncbi:unnamed protein product [Lactuca saligna]|uniref:Uncharacterized protein n=1 Tax=Lactuca saligna TaxID=75948 RepID=A0AA35V8U7_LACSI|nr:unnamed protein product [Lactuca saligna]